MNKHCKKIIYNKYKIYSNIRKSLKFWCELQNRKYMKIESQKIASHKR